MNTDRTIGKRWVDWGRGAAILLVFSVGVTLLLLWLAGKFAPKVSMQAERVSASEDSRGSGMLSVLVMYKGDRDIRPAVGFFNLAREQGYDLPDKDTEDIFWAKQLEKVYDEHSRRRKFRRRRG